MDFSFREKEEVTRNEFYAHMNPVCDNKEYFVGYGNFKMKPHYPKLLLGKQLENLFYLLHFSRKSSFMLPRIFAFEDFPFDDFGYFQKKGGLSNYVLLEYEHTQDIKKFIQSSSKNSPLESLVTTISQITSSDIDGYFNDSFQEYVSKELHNERDFRLRMYHNTPKHLTSL